MLTMTFNFHSVKADSGAIIINPNGSITPLTANITTSDNITYTFTGNNYLPIVVNRSNIIINGMGHTLQASGQNGFSLTGMSNVTIKNTTITNSYDGIDLESSSGNVLSGNSVTENGGDGICLIDSSGNVLSGNDATANSGDGIALWFSSDNNTLSGNNITANSLPGIWLDPSSDNLLSRNNVTANSDGGIGLFSSDNNTLFGNSVTANRGPGIYLDSSSGNVLSGNVMASNQWNFGVSGGVLSDFVNHVDASNLVDGKPICYLINQSNMVISPKAYPEGVGYVGLVNCKNVTVRDLTLTKTSPQTAVMVLASGTLLVTLYPATT
jgi:parallel beta-helix repeat protein